MKIRLALIVSGLSLLAGCATSVQAWSPPDFKENIDLVDAVISPACEGGTCYGFKIGLTNNTDKPVEIDWNRSYYTQNGQTNGGLMSAGVVIAQRNLMRPPDVILPSGSYLKTVWPSNFTMLRIGLTTIDWINELLPEGRQGVYLTLKQGNKEAFIKAEMTMQITYPNGKPGISIGNINLINADR